MENSGMQMPVHFVVVLLLKKLYNCRSLFSRPSFYAIDQNCVVYTPRGVV